MVAKEEYSRVSSSETPKDKFPLYKKQKYFELKNFSLTKQSYIIIETRGIVPQNQTTPEKYQQMTAKISAFNK